MGTCALRHVFKVHCGLQCRRVTAILFALQRALDEYSDRPSPSSAQGRPRDILLKRTLRGRGAGVLIVTQRLRCLGDVDPSQGASRRVANESHTKRATLLGKWGVDVEAEDPDPSDPTTLEVLITDRALLGERCSS